MNVKIIKERTCILMLKHQHEKLNAVFASINILKDVPLIWSRSEGYYYVKKKLHADVVAEIQKRYKQLFEKPKVIRGYQGCPITLNGFSWKV